MAKPFKIALLSLSVIFLSLVAFSQASAQATIAEDVVMDETVTAEDLGVVEPTTGILGFFQNVRNTVQSALTFDPVKKAELKLKQANQALLMAQNYLENNPDNQKAQEKYEKYLEKYEQKMEQVKERIGQLKEKAEENPKIDALLDKLTDNAFKQQRLMDKVSGFLNEDLKAELQSKRDSVLEKVGQVFQQLEEPEKLQARLENALENQAGSHLINLKNLEVLKALEDKVPEQALEGIRNAQQNAVRRLNEGLKQLDRDEVKERLKEYFDNSNSDPLLQVEILEVLNETAGVDNTLRTLIPEVRTEKLERVDEMIEEAADEGEKVRQLERIRQIEDPAVKSRLRLIEEKYLESDASDDAPLNADSLKAEIRNVNREQERKVEGQEQKAELKIKGDDGQVRYEAEYKREDDGREKTEIKIEPVEIREREREEINREAEGRNEIED